jgi:arylsulfatase A-like enzyme
MTGQYAWRNPAGAGILSGEAPLAWDPAMPTTPSLLKKAGYTTGVVGKWHMGLGKGDIDFNKEIRPGPLDVGFDYAFIFPATGDRIPCVYIENNRVVGLDPADPIATSYKNKIGSDPTGKENPELLTMKPSHGHDATIVSGISRIGWMSGGKAARWVDEDMADTFAAKASAFIEKNKKNPFFLYFATHDVHVPRVPHPRFAGKTAHGPRGDAIVQFDSTVGEILKTLDRLKLAKNTLVIFTSDNGPVVDDGYKDEAVEKLGDHKPAGPLRGGKYSIFEGGTRVPWVVRWPARVKPGVSGALVCQIDLLASFAALTGQRLADADAPDSFNVLPALLGESKTGRERLVEDAQNRLALREGEWKVIEGGRPRNRNAGTGSDTAEQLYNLGEDLGETKDLGAQNPEKVKEAIGRLEEMRQNPRSRP